jgi:hypothetical protein
MFTYDLKSHEDKNDLHPKSIKSSVYKLNRKGSSLSNSLLVESLRRGKILSTNNRLEKFSVLFSYKNFKKKM